MIDRKTLVFLLVATAVLSTACSSMSALTNPPACSVESRCYVEDLPGASLAAIRSNGSSLSVSCPLAGEIGETYRLQCKRTLAAAIDSLARWPNELSVPDIADVRLEERQTCIDTFVPGREGADCRYYHIEAIIPLRWH